MKSQLQLLLIVLLAFSTLRCSGQLTSNVFERVLKVRVNAGTSHEGTATAFTVDVDGREYLVTAKHVVAGLKELDHIDVFVFDKWTSISVGIYRCDDPIDIAILIPPYQMTVDYDLPFDKGTFLIGQQALFVGFPLGLQLSGLGVNGAYPVGITKRGTISGVVALDASKNASIILLDGYNNPGFSGAPVVLGEPSAVGVTFQLLGVISGFIPEIEPVMRKQSIESPAKASDAAKAQPWRIQKNNDNTYSEFVDNDTYTMTNTGIVQVISIQPAIDLIKKHPIGPTVKPLVGNIPLVPTTP